MDKRRPILITGSHRSGSTWVGRTLALSRRVHYLGEVLRPDSSCLGAAAPDHWFPYLTPQTGSEVAGHLARVLAFRFVPQGRKGFTSLLPSRLAVYRITRRWFGFPRPLLKDPIAVLSAEWLADTFDMDVLCLVRHPAAFVASLVRVGWRFDFGNFLEQPRLMADWLHPFAAQLADPPRDPVGEGALLWLCIYHVLTGFLARSPGWFEWRLEDIAKHPTSAFEMIFSGLDLPYTSRIRRSVVRSSAPTNPARAPASDPHQIRRDSRAVQNLWRKELKGDDVARIRRVTAPVAHRYYSDADW